MGFFDKLKINIEEGPEEKIEKVKKVEKPRFKEKPKEEQGEPEAEKGQLAIDLYETNGEFIIQSTVAGVKPEDLDITIEKDMVTIQGSRQKSTELEGKKYYYQECYWGSFFKQVILPEEVDDSKTEATIKDGVLTLRLPKVKKVQKRKITVKPS